MKTFITYESAICTEIEHKIEFGGKVYRPDRAKAMFDAVICHSLPKGNANDRGFSAATLANSYRSAELQLCDFDHRLDFYGNTDDGEDRVCGTIAAIEYPDREKAIKAAAAGDPVPLRALLVAFRKAKGVEKMIADIASKKWNWRTSIEVEYAVDEAALFDTVDKKFYAWDECDEEMKALVKPAAVEDYKGHKMLFCPGGKDGNFVVSGCAFTRWPADKDATLQQMAACEKPTKIILLSAGWRNGSDYRQAIATAAAAAKTANADDDHLAQETAAEAWHGSDAPDKFFAYVPKEAQGQDGKKSLRKFPLASKEKKGLDPAILRDALARFSQANIPAAEKPKVRAKILAAVAHWNTRHPDQKITTSDKSGSDPIIGYTDAGPDGHKHPITKNLMILPAGLEGQPKHGHYMAMMSLETEPDGLHLCGVTSLRGDWMSPGMIDQVPDDNGLVNGGTGSNDFDADDVYTEHCHTFDLGGMGHSELSGVVGVEVESMDIKERISALRKSAQAVATSNPAESKVLMDLANQMEKEHATEDVEQVVAARIKNGDLVPKAQYETAVSTARKEGEEKVRKELEDSKKSEELKAQTIAARMDAIKKAKLEPTFALGKDKTIASVVSAIPVGEAGDKVFAERLDEWITISKQTGQMVAKEGAAATETASTTATRPPVASSNSSAGAASKLSFA